MILQEENILILKQPGDLVSASDSAKNTDYFLKAKIISTATLMAVGCDGTNTNTEKIDYLDHCNG